MLAVVYLIYTAGHSATGKALVDTSLCTEAVRPARVLTELMPDEPEALGLLALLLLLESRSGARTDADGALVPLAEQDRARWDPALAAEGQALVRRLLRRGRPGPYQVQAAIQAVHADGVTDWAQVLALYDLLLVLQPAPVVALNRAVALAEVAGPAAALAVFDELALHAYQPFHAVRADLLRRVGRAAEAEQAYGRAIALASNGVERRFLESRRAGLPDP